MEAFSESPKNVMCPGCGYLNSQMDDFCSRCSAPLTTHAATDPMGSIMSQGYAFGKAASKPGSLLVVAGLWLLAVPTLLMTLQFLPFFVGALIRGIMQMDPGEILGGVLSLALMSLLLAIYVGLAFKSTKNYLRGLDEKKEIKQTKEGSEAPTARSIDDGQNCLACGQTIPAREKQCPECGWSWDGN